jgi:sulfide:quinone oxidoreductase
MPAPYEGALLLHGYLVDRGVRDPTRIDVISAVETPIPVSPETSVAIVHALAERDIGYTRAGGYANWTERACGQAADRGSPLRPLYRDPGTPAPAVLHACGLTAGGTGGWVAVDRRNLATQFPGVYALGDCADPPVPRAGVFAEIAARAVADGVAAKIHSLGTAEPFDGTGSCYIEFGAGLVGKVDADFLSGPVPKAPLPCPLGRAGRLRRNGSPPADVGAGSAPDPIGTFARSMPGDPRRTGGAMRPSAR